MESVINASRRRRERNGIENWDKSDKGCTFFIILHDAFIRFRALVRKKSRETTGTEIAENALFVSNPDLFFENVGYSI